MVRLAGKVNARSEVLNRKVPGSPSTEGPRRPPSDLLRGGIMILLFFLENLRIIDFEAVERFWPLALVFLGLYLIYDYYRRKSPAAPGTSRRPAPGDGMARDSPQAPKEATHERGFTD